MTLEFSVTKGNDVAGPDLVVLLDRGVGEVGVDEGAVGAGADGEEHGGERGEEVVDEGVGRAVADDGVLFAFGGFGDANAESGVGVFELVLAEARGWWFVALFEGCVGWVLRIETGGDDGLRVVHVEDVDVPRGCGLSASLR